MTVNMVERPKGVHTAVGGKAEQGVSWYSSPPHTPPKGPG